MDRYKNYLDKLKNFSPEPNFPKMHNQLKEKLARKPFLTLPKLALTSGLATILIGIAIFSYANSYNHKDEGLVYWVLSHDYNNSDDKVIVG